MTETLAALSLAVDLVQALSALSGEFAKVSQIISKRLSEGRTSWTDEERDALMAELYKAKMAAHKSVVDIH